MSVKFSLDCSFWLVLHCARSGILEGCRLCKELKNVQRTHCMPQSFFVSPSLHTVRQESKIELVR